MTIQTALARKRLAIPNSTEQWSTLPPREVCDQARKARDLRFDGLFFIAVRSTKIYCRLTCPAPTPKPENVSYFPNAASASEAGFRPCLRCRPELAPDAYRAHSEAAVRRALERIVEGCLQNESVQALSKSVGLSARQLQRQFVLQTGATPHRVHATQRLLLAKQLLSDTALSMTDVAMAAGYNSLRRFNADFQAHAGRAPSGIRRREGHFAAADAGLLRLTLHYRPPLDFPLMLSFLQKRAIPGVEHIDLDRQSYQRLCAHEGSFSWLRVSACIPDAKPSRAGSGNAAKRERSPSDGQRPDGPFQDGQLQLELLPSSAKAIPDLLRRVRRMFDLDADLRSVHAVLGQDPLLAECLLQRPGLRVPVGFDGFEVAVRAVLGQQVSVAAATTFARRVVEHFGQVSALTHPGDSTLTRGFPRPKDMLSVTANELAKRIQIPARRAETLHALASAAERAELRFDGGQRLEDFVAACCAIPGIGPWTAQYLALRGLAQPDAYPAGDLVLQQVLAQSDPTVGKERLSEAQCEQRGQRYRPWRAYAVLHLWHHAQAKAAAVKALAENHKTPRGTLKAPLKIKETRQ